MFTLFDDFVFVLVLGAWILASSGLAIPLPWRCQPR